MSVGLLLITHAELGRNMLQAATGILGKCPLNADAIAVHADSEPDKVMAAALKSCTELEQGDGVLILTDLYGSTPSNIATRLLEKHNALIITGLNLPMLVRILNYATYNLEELGSKASSGARDGIMITARKKVS